MKRVLTLTFAIVIVVIVSVALTREQPQVAASKRYDVSIGLVVAITDHQENKVFVYSEKENSYLQLQATIDLTQAGRERIDYIKLEPRK